MRTEEVRLATDNVLTLRLLEPASVNLRLRWIDHSVRISRVVLSRVLIFKVTQRTTSIACRYLLQFLDGFDLFDVTRSRPLSPFL